MTLVVRRRVAVLVPWLALAAVTVFAIVQMRARHAAEQGEPVGAAVTTPPPEVVPAPVRTDATEGAHAAEAALDAALLDLAAARAEAARLAAEGAAAQRRAEAAEARLAVHVARVAALREELEALRAAAEERTDTAPAPGRADGEADVAAEVRAWVEDADAQDPVRVRQAAERAASAKPAQIRDLERLRAAGANPIALARLAAALPAGEASDALVVGLLLDERGDLGAATRMVHTLGSQTLLREAVLDALLGRATPGVLKVALGLLAGYESELGDDERRSAMAAALTPRLKSGDAAQLHAGARAAGLLRLPGFAPRLVLLLAHEDGSVRVAAAHALSLVPDLPSVRAEATKALPGLLLDRSLSVRTAGALLAEALVGAPLAYDPAAGEGARREAVDAILDRLD